jgi:hypothetical protein
MIVGSRLIIVNVILPDWIYRFSFLAKITSTNFVNVDTVTIKLTRESKMPRALNLMVKGTI